MAIKLGELLVRANLITEAQLKAALSEQQKWGGKLGEILVRMSFCTEDLVVKALSKQLGIVRVDLDNVQAPPESVLAKIPQDLCRDLNVLPLQLKDDGKTLVIAAADPTNLEITDALRARTGCKILTMIAGATALTKARGRFYFGEENLGDAGDDPGFKIQGSDGHTLVKNLADIKPPPAAQPAKAPARPPAPPVAAQKPAPPTAGTGSPAEVLGAIEAVQRKEVSALKAMVELLIEKGVFTREEYLARVKR